MTLEDAKLELWELKSATNQKIEKFKACGDNQGVHVQEGFLAGILQIEQILERIKNG